MTEDNKEKGDLFQRRTNIWKLLASMPTAITLLVILGALASLGTLIPQGAPKEVYLELYGAFLGKFIYFLALDHVYSAWWFLLLGVIFSLNLFLCSLGRLKGMKKVREAGSIVLHISILIIFIGSAVSAVYGVRENVDIPVGDTLDLTTVNFPGYALTVRDFKIEFYENQEPRQYKCALYITDQSGHELVREIMVNHPLNFRGIKIYQQSYGWQVKGSISGEGETRNFQMKEGEELPLNSQEDLVLKTIFIPDFDEQSKSLRSLSPMPNNPVLACALIQGQNLGEVEFLTLGEQKKLGPYTLDFTDYRYYSGLSIKKDPGTRIVYGGFLLMTIGFLIRYIPLHQAARKEDKKNGDRT